MLFPKYFAEHERLFLKGNPNETLEMGVTQLSVLFWCSGGGGEEGDFVLCPSQRCARTSWRNGFSSTPKCGGSWVQFSVPANFREESAAFLGTDKYFNFFVVVGGMRKEQKEGGSFLK